MTVATILYASLCILFTVAGLEAYVRLVEYYRGRWIVILFYALTVGVFFLSPMLSVELVSESFSYLRDISKPAWLILWIGSICVYLFLIRERLGRVLKSAGP